MRRAIITPNGHVETAGCLWCTDEAVCSACHAKARALREGSREGVRREGVQMRAGASRRRAGAKRAPEDPQP